MARGGGSGGSSASWGLDAGLLIRREDILVGAERLAFPKAVVEVDYRLDERAEGRVPRDLPSAEAPRSEDIGPEISGDGRAAGSVGHLVTDLPSDVGIGEAAERKPPGERAARSAQTGLMTAGGGMARRKGLSFRGRHLRREAFPTSRMGGGSLLTPRSPLPGAGRGPTP